MRVRSLFPLALCVVAALGLVGCQSGGERFVSAYAGPYTDNSLPEEFALVQKLSFEDATLAAVSLSQVVRQPSDRYRFELEGNVVRWFGGQDHTELNGLFLFRWLTLPWDRFLDTSLALGNGFSLASSSPDLEVEFHPDTGSSRLLYHIALEVEFGLPGSAGDWATFVRVHHRSGVFGLFSGVDGGSNVLAAGLRYRL